MFLHPNQTNPLATTELLTLKVRRVHSATRLEIQQQQQQQQHSLFSQASWGRLEMKPERKKFKVQAH